MAMSGLRIALVLLLAAGGGALQARLRGLPWRVDVAAMELRKERKDAVRGRHAELRATVGVTLEEFQAAIARGATIIDARSPEEFEKEHLATESIPPVLNIYPEKFIEHLARLSQLQGTEIFIYCTSSECELGEELYVLLEQNGFTGMKVYFPGWEGLKAAGVPVASGPDTWTGYDMQPSAVVDDGEPVEPVAPAAEDGAAPDERNPADPSESRR